MPVELARRESVWQALVGHQKDLEATDLVEMFGQDPERASRLTYEACDLVVDLSRNRLVARTIDLLVRLAETSRFEERRDAMFAGEIVNGSERRPALHTALRNRSDRPVLVDGKDVMPEVRAVLERMGRLADAVRDGSWRGFTGRRIHDVVNIGIGGSDLGPHMAAVALDGWRAPELAGHYVSNLDSAHLEGVLRGLDPETTLFVVASKSFSTEETITNATSARTWLVDALGNEAAVARHFVAVSTNLDRVRRFGIDPEHAYGFWDWVGGRYSLWSAIGLSVMLLVGKETFGALLEGAHAMDEHFRTAPLDQNLPVLLGMLSVWYVNFLEKDTHAVLPYDWALRLLPDHLQQLEMESTGKRVRQDGTLAPDETCPVVWGGPGDNGQHAYYQRLHQGTSWVPIDLVVSAESQAPLPGHQDGVLANAFAQAEALMRGRSEADARRALESDGVPADEARRLAPHKAMPGNRPSTTILYRRLTPHVLGALVALYEHKVFTMGTVWQVNPFDQWGVELGKRLARGIREDLARGVVPEGRDPATRAMVARVLGWRRAGA